MQILMDSSRSPARGEGSLLYHAPWGLSKSGAMISPPAGILTWDSGPIPCFVADVPLYGGTERGWETRHGFSNVGGSSQLRRGAQGGRENGRGRSALMSD